MQESLSKNFRQQNVCEKNKTRKKLNYLFRKYRKLIEKILKI